MDIAGLSHYRRYAWLLIWFLAFGLILFLHVWQISSLPRGLYADESSIGYNASLIAQTLHDEHHVLLPIYFQAFGEYKNPLYIYTTAILFKVLGISVLVLRLTSTLYFGLLLAGMFALARVVFPGKCLVWLFAVLATGFSPWFFSLSRISFEVISQPAVVVWALYFLYRAYEHEQARRPGVEAIVAGLLTGTSVYAYSTGRILGFGLALIVLMVYWNRFYWKRHTEFLTGLTGSLIPMALFWWQNPGALTARFEALSYVFNPSLSTLRKTGLFIFYYMSYFNPSF